MKWQKIMELFLSPRVSVIIRSLQFLMSSGSVSIFLVLISLSHSNLISESISSAGISTKLSFISKSTSIPSEA